jgi:SH3 domain protein
MKKTNLFHLFIHPSFLIFVLVSVLFAFPDFLNAETKFISGVIVVNIRESIEKQSQVIGTVKTGDEVEVLEEKENSSRVRTKGSIEGWLPSHYLHADIPAVETILKLKEELSTLKKKHDQLNQTKTPPDSVLQEEQRKKLNQSLDSLKTENKRLLEDNQKLLHIIQENERSLQARTADNSETEALKGKVVSLQNKLDDLTKNTRDIINITNERDRLASEAENIKAELSRLQKLNQTFKTDKMFYWFFAGAAVFFIGLLSSKIFTRKKSKLTF